MKKLAEIQLSYKPTFKDSPTILSSHDAYLALMDFYPEETIALQERFVVIYLNNSNKVLGIQELACGGRSSCLVDVRLLFATALKAAATGIVLSHNHPSYVLKPSRQDMIITDKIKSAGELLDIKLVDHLIISPNNDYLSFADDGHL